MTHLLPGRTDTTIPDLWDRLISSLSARLPAELLFTVMKVFYYPCGSPPAGRSWYNSYRRQIARKTPSGLEQNVVVAAQSETNRLLPVLFVNALKRAPAPVRAFVARLKQTQQNLHRHSGCSSGRSPPPQAAIRVNQIRPFPVFSMNDEARRQRINFSDNFNLICTSKKAAVVPDEPSAECGGEALGAASRSTAAVWKLRSRKPSLPNGPSTPISASPEVKSRYGNEEEAGQTPNRHRSSERVPFAVVLGHLCV